jgi:DNA-binding transcriptional regulator GbsR (MarR family)
MTNLKSTPSHDELIDLAGQMAEMFSFNRSIGQIFGCLYLSPGPLSLEEIAVRCQMSKGNASIHLRTLHGWGAVHLASKLGTRKDYYRAETDLVDLASRRIQEGAKKRMVFVRQKINMLKSEPHFAGDPQQQAHWTQRLEEIERIVTKAEKAYPFLLKYLELRKLF